MEGKGVCFSGAHKIKGKEVEERGRGEERRREERRLILVLKGGVVE